MIQQSPPSPEKALPPKPASHAASAVSAPPAQGSLIEQVTSEIQRVFSPDNPHLKPGLLMVGMFVLLMVAYGNMLSLTATIWRTPQYSFGWMIPIVSIVMLWVSREPLKTPTDQERWIGVGIVTAALLARVFFGAIWRTNTLDMYTFVPATLGAVVFMGGWSALAWMWKPIVFLIFMFPIPQIVENMILTKLQLLGTQVSTFALQTLGIAAYYQGNVIHVGAERLQVEEACAGLRMTSVFVGMCVGMAMFMPMRPWERVIMLISGVPIALAANMSRILLTSLLFMVPGLDGAHETIHDLMGYFMVVIGLAFAYLEWLVISKLIIEEQPTRGQPVNVRPAGAKPVLGR